MKAVLKKLKAKAGETLIETLAAILVFTMASIVMFTLVNSAANINQTAKEMDQTNQVHMIAVEKGEPEAINGCAIIKLYLNDAHGNLDTEVAQTLVDIYGGQDGSLFTYFMNIDHLGLGG